MSDQLSLHARAVLAEEVSRLGGKPDVALDVVRFGIGDLAARCFVSKTDEVEGSHVAMLAFDLKLEASRKESVHDTAIGIADSEEEAVAVGVRNWMGGVLPPVQACLKLGEDKVQPFVLSQTDPKGAQPAKWQVFGGPLQVAGGERDALVKVLDPVPPFAFLANNGALPLFPRSSGLFWMKIYCARQGSGSTLGECKVNNIDWPVGVEALSKLGWPPGPGFMMFRQFLAGRISE